MNFIGKPLHFFGLLFPFLFFFFLFSLFFSSSSPHPLYPSSSCCLFHFLSIFSSFAPLSSFRSHSILSLFFLPPSPLHSGKSTSNVAHFFSSLFHLCPLPPSVPSSLTHSDLVSAGGSRTRVDFEESIACTSPSVILAQAVHCDMQGVKCGYT